MSSLSGALRLPVLSPLAQQFGGAMGSLAARPASLDGLHVGLLWNAKANGDVALRAVGEQLEQRSTNLRTTFYTGSVPSSPEVLERVASECDVVIGCPADCGGCTTWLTHDAVLLEQRGVPTVVIGSAGFLDDIEASARAFGLPSIQYVGVPKVFNNIRAEEAVDQALAVAGEIVQLLTSGVPSGEDSSSHRAPREDGDGPRVFSGATYEEAFTAFNHGFLERDWGDGYPLLPPTAERVDELIGAVSAPADDVICHLPPANGHATVEAVAVNAAMAGCRPGEMLVVMAALRALSRIAPPFNFAGLVSTGAHAPMFFVNGPLARELGINGGRGCLGPGKQNAANLRIGRAILLCLKNVGCWNLGVMDMDCIGSPRKHVVVLAENEAESPWPAFHVDHGFDAEQSTVTVVLTSGEFDICFSGHTSATNLARSIGSMINGTPSLPTMSTQLDLSSSPEGRLVLLPPPHAVPLHEGGFSKSRLAAIWHEQVGDSIERVREPLSKYHRDGLMRPEWEFLFEAEGDEARRTMVHTVEAPDRFYIVVAGSVRAKNMVFPTITIPVIELITTTPNGTPAS